MKLVFLITIAMLAFAGNSILTRVGVAVFGMDPLMFAFIRVAAGVVTLLVLVALRSGPKPVWRQPKRLAGAVALAVYMIGFSAAYLALDTGLGALILFGVLQIVMFGWARVEGQVVSGLSWLGAGVALIGLVILLWPHGDLLVPPVQCAAMISAGVGWAVYTLLGRNEPDPLGATAVNFTLCLPLVAVALLWAPDLRIDAGGAVTAALAGSVTSAMGYALWYRVLPQLATVTASIAQLSVPLIAAILGFMLLQEDVTWRLALAGVLVIGGIAISVLRRRG